MDKAIRRLWAICRITRQLVPSATQTAFLPNTFACRNARNCRLPTFPFRIVDFVAAKECKALREAPYASFSAHFATRFPLGTNDCSLSDHRIDRHFALVYGW
jgi:hypothetical protein